MRPKLRPGAIVLALLLAPTLLAPSTLATGLVPPVEVRALDVTTRIDSGYAVTEVTLALHNPSDNPLATSLRVPVPEGAFPSNLTLVVDGRTLHAQVVEAQAAQAAFDAAAAAGRNAGLLAMREPQLFQYDLTLAPRGNVTATLRYEAFLARELGRHAVAIPLPAAPGPVAAEAMTARILVSDPRGVHDLNATGPGAAAIETPDATRASATFTGGWNGGETLSLQYATGETPPEGFLLTHEDAASRYFLHVLAPTPETARGILPKHVVFVLDVSGSMAGLKLEQMKTAAASILGELREGDTFNLVAFSSGASARAEGPTAATPDAIRDAQSYVRGLQIGGGTNIHEALQAALTASSREGDRLPLVVFLTDGVPTEGVTDGAAIRRGFLAANAVNATLYTLGFGDDVDMGLLEALALENGGVAKRIRADRDAAAQIGRFFDTVSTPLLKDLRFAYGDAARDVHPAALPHLFAGSEAAVVGRAPKTLAALPYTVEAVSADGPFRASGTVSFDASQPLPFVARLWAYRNLQATLDRIKVEGETPALKALATAQAVEAGFVTRYTSFLVEDLAPAEEVDETEAPEAVLEEFSGGFGKVGYRATTELDLADGAAGATPGNFAPGGNTPGQAVGDADHVAEPGIPGFGAWALLAALAVAVALKRRRA